MSQISRAGFVCLVGRPNAGKSTLLNALVGDPVAIVSPKPQTTRRNLRGILSRHGGQAVLVDTPGLGPLRTLLGRAMRQATRQALADCDVVLCILGASERWPTLPRSEGQVLQAAADSGKPIVVALNKVDRVRQKRVLLPTMAEVARCCRPQAVVPTSGRDGEGLEVLMEEVAQCLPPGPALYDPQLHTDQVERRLAEDLIFQQLLMHLHQEVPHRCAVVVEEFSDRRDQPEPHCHLSARIYVERPSQKAIVVGRAGHGVREVGARARARIGQLLGCTTHLVLQVVVAEGWTDRRGRLQDFGLLGPDLSTRM